jgi:hypothetical protein
VPETGLRRVYERDLLLLRPDLHVCWRGESAPADPAGVASIVTGRIARAHWSDSQREVATMDKGKSRGS